MDVNYLKTGNLTVNGVPLAYGIRAVDDIDPYTVDILFMDGEILGDIPMGEEDYADLDLIDLEDTVYCAAEGGLIPDVARYCHIRTFGGE